MSEPRPSERTVFFTDAVVAIAMTLLVLPLADGVAEVARHHGTTSDFLHGHGSELLSCGISFLVIWSFWDAHERLFSGVERTTAALARLNLVWLAMIVWLPVATALVGDLPRDGLQAALYIGSMLVASVALTAMGVYLRRHPELRDEESAARGHDLWESLTLCAAFVAAFVVAVFTPIGYLGLLLLVVARPAAIVLRRRARGH